MKENNKLLYILILFIVCVAVLSALTIKKDKVVFELQTSEQSEKEILSDSQVNVMCFNINDVTKDELISIDGIGEKTANRIIEYRTLNGKFQSFDELYNIENIGPKTFEILSQYLFLDVENTSSQTYTQTNSITKPKQTIATTTSIIETTTEISTEQTEISTEIQINYPIDINTATMNELMSIKGIGEVKATAIIEYRNSKRIIYSIDELLEVKGIGEKTLDEIKKYVYCDEVLPVTTQEPPLLKANQIDLILETTATTTEETTAITTEETTAIITEETTELTSISETPAPPPSVVNLNSSSEEDLIACLDISKEIAEKIIYHRNNKGFDKTLELVMFISKEKYNTIRDKVIV